MWKPDRQTGTLVVLSGILALSNTACQSTEPAIPGSDSTKTTVAFPSPSPSATPQPQPQPTASPVTATPKKDTYQDAIAAASGAITISESAVSRDDWSLVANRWQEAINLLKVVPTSSANSAKAKAKLTEYKRHLAVAQEKATPVPEKPKQGDTSPKFFSVPVKARLAGIPVVEVTFNGKHKFDMVFDTGASGTLVTTSAAYTLQLQSVGTKQITVADGARLELPITFVPSMEVDSRLKRKVEVTVAPPSMPIGLLGQDFFQGYDIAIKEKVIEFRKR